MRKMIALFTACVLCLAAGGCAASNATYYEHAQLYLGAGDFAQAALMFSQLGEYEDSADYALYCAGLEALSQGETALARANMEQVKPFKSSERYLLWMDAAALEEAGKLEEALAIYAALGSFEDSADRAQELRAAIPERDLHYARTLMDASRWEQALTILNSLNGYGDSAQLIAQCEESITQAAYDQAEELYNQGQYNDALAAFEALGDTLDAKARALMCRSAMYQQLEKEYRSVTLSTAQGLMDRYAEMEDYLDSAARLQTLEARYHVNLQLLSAAYARPYVRLGAYPTDESGASSPLLWRVIAHDGATLTLLCENVVDAMPIASATDLPLDVPQEASDSISIALPAREDIAALDAAALTCPATAYAIAQGVQHHSDGSAWWWLNSPLPNGRSAIVWYNGTVIESGVDAAETTIGVRPMVTLDLETFAFTGGSGTPQDPFY